MRKHAFFSIAVAATFLVAGCASSPTGGDTAGSSAETTVQPRIAAPVAIPPASRRRVVLALTGPAAVVQSKDWDEFRREWRETFADHAREAGIEYSFSDAVPRPTGQDGTILLVDIDDYRIVGVGSRIFFGAMTSNAFISARVKFSSLRDGVPFGEQQYSTTSSAWSGIFAKVTPQQVDSIATSVFRDLVSAE